MAKRIRYYSAKYGRWYDCCMTRANLRRIFNAAMNTDNVIEHVTIYG